MRSIRRYTSVSEVHIFNIPVVLLIFNRVNTTARVFSEIAKVKPRTLLVVADGPRASRAGEDQLCSATRSIIDTIDWPCQLYLNYADENLGCRQRVASGLTWAFDNVEEAIVLEDDCVPDPSFFGFCEELLDRYRDDTNVWHIGGSNFQFERHSGKSSYYFSRYPYIWGWATWRRAWQHYDVDMKRWKSAEDRNEYLKAFPTRDVQRYWAAAWDAAGSGKLDTWDYQWAFACIANNGLAVVPNANLISNIGFGGQATHTRGASRLADRPLQSIGSPLSHPKDIVVDTEADVYVSRHFFSAPGRLRSLVSSVRHRLSLSSKLS